MAAEVPAKDVLCEAMEYLSKLGTNLRTRSDKLKEKKGRRVEFNNVLAVQKTARKVLLICELSKKSLVNVENGVRKVLELIDSSQASSSNGGKSPQFENVEKEPKYYYFEYKTRKLKIKNRISFKHYNSVKVHAKMLPKSMMDKYPVHYDCKLYRMRKNQEELLKVQKGPIKEDIEKSIQEDISIISILDTPILKPKSDNNNGNDVSIISIPDSPNLNDDNKRNDRLPLGKNCLRKSSVESTSDKDSDSDQSQKNKSDKSDKRRPRHRRRHSDTNHDRKKPTKRKRIISDSSCDNEKEADIDSETKENILASKGDSSDISSNGLDSKKHKLNVDSHITKPTVDGDIAEQDTVDDDNDDAENNTSKPSHITKPTVDEDIAEQDTVYNDNDDAENNTSKPVIKCVSLSKLLKPNVLEKEKVIGPHSKPKDSRTKAKEKEEATQVRNCEKQAIKEKEEEEYRKLKRKEVSSFRSKNFAINITRLPELSLNYLNKLCLKKITQGGITICEIADKNLDEANLNNKNRTANCKKRNEKIIKSGESKSNSRRNSSKSSDDHDDALIAEANKVKNALLNESDSDDIIGSDNELKSKCVDTIKSALLKDSDSETKKSDDGSNSGDCDNADKEVVSETEQNKNSNSCSDKNINSALLAEEVKNSEDEPKLDDQDNPDKDSVSEMEQAKRSLCKESDFDLNKCEPQCTTVVAKEDADMVDGAANKPDKSFTEKDDDSVDKSLDENNFSDALVDINDEILSETQKHEKTPEREIYSENAKSSLLNDSSTDQATTPLSQRLTPHAKKKRMRESIQAKKMLLNYSSSDTEDEQLKISLKDVKDSLLHGSDEEKEETKQEKESSSSSGEDIIKKVKKKNVSKPLKEKRAKRKKKIVRRLDSEESSKSSDDSKSNSSKMVRSKSKPGNSSCQNSDVPDSNDKHIDGLTNLNSLNKPRRRNSNSSEMSEASATYDKVKAKGKSTYKIKPTGLISEDILKAESSSESAAASADEIDNDDMPEITIPSINGGGEHLVKEDLLGESDSSVSHNDDVKSIKEESGSEDKLQAKRRKANAISSDSEVGSSRKKDADVKLSDFEDSDDSDINNKRSKRKKKPVDSDASVGTVSSNEGGKKKRRRIKSVRDSDASGSESETEGRNKHGRKNIRKVMGKNQLEEATKKAARQEKERMARIAERQKMYNNMEFDETGKPDEVVLDKVVLDFDPETKEPLIEVDRGLVKKLKPHQANGIKFMWDACFESVKRIKKDRGSGCILAHCMGLGKTLQVVSLTHTLLTHSELTSVHRVLVVCPLSTVLNWVNEFRMWLKYAETENDVEVYELSRYKQNSERSFQLSQWIRHGGVCVLGYEMFRNLSADNVKKFKKKMLKTFQDALVDPGPDMVVCDEGHLLKNEKTSLSQSMNRVKTHRRIVLTGTPLQNNLKEYYCMVQFVKPNLLGKYNEYLNRFVNPITNGQYTDSTEHDIKIMKRRSHVLHKMLDGAVQRRDYGVLAPFLPPKHEYVLFITLAEVQTKLYQHYLDNFSRRPSPGKSSGFLFPDFQSLQRIWTHPLVLKYNSERYEIMQQKKRDKEEEELESEGSLRDFIDDDSTSEESSMEETTEDSSDASDDSRKKSKKKKKSAKKSKGKDKDKDKEGKGDGGQSRPRRGTRANPVEVEDEDKEDEPHELKNENPTEWWIKLVSDEELDDMRNSHKLVLLFDILRQCETIGDKLLVFSQSLYSLDLIEHFLGKVDDATQEGRIDDKLGRHIGTWSPGVDYFRLDGSTSCENRSIWCKNFNREDNPRARLFLISTRAGGLGINLVAANRVVIFDVSWNPSHDVQSIFRVYRFGQKKPCYVYRFLAMGTMEEKIYERQVTKQAISKRVIDEQQIDRHYAENDLAELYNFEPQPPSPRPIPPLPKDRLFAEMLREHEVQIYKYHEHDSLLENKEEETLSEEERKAAWEDFENEKNKPPPAPFPNTWQMPNLLQQQQLAYAALAAMLRKDMPNLSDNQLRDMLPVIYNTNPQMFGGYDYGLMQKLNEIYKYSPGMMNPGMMNPGVMNAAGGVGGLAGMGGASGLQYEPPWQRQQQQQQQMRLQQLLQHQNQMGAKFYAGGLGSRDPVAMALQQQRAREIMLGGAGGAVAGGAGRPRGRPPLAPRAPAAADVVNLDSD